MDVYGADLMGPYAAFGSPASAIHIAGGLSTDIMGGAWRWAYPKAETRFYLPSKSGWSAKLEFAIAKSILDKTGPQVLTIFVNNNKADELHYDHDGNYVWKKPVPEDWLVPAGMNYIRIETDKTTPDPGGHQLAFILTKAGFVRADAK